MKRMFSDLHKRTLRDSTGSIVGVEKDFEPRTGHYQLIGDCYYDGYMDGEGLDDEKFPAQPILLVWKPVYCNLHGDHQSSG
jgi:hypothetical protein